MESMIPEHNCKNIEVIEMLNFYNSLNRNFQELKELFNSSTENNKYVILTYILDNILLDDNVTQFILENDNMCRLILKAH